MNVPTRPPTVGPSAGATATTMPPTPISMPILLFGDCSRMILNINGSAIPVPAPCSIRAVISIGKFNVQATIRQPVMQSTIAVRKMVRNFSLRLK